jgi:hypothetical protein
MDEGVHATRFLGRQVGGDVEVLHFAGNLRLEGRGIEPRDAADAALAGGQVFPGFGYRIADRGDYPQAGHHYAASRHGLDSELTS